jgi:hypothetical protein
MNAVQGFKVLESGDKLHSMFSLTSKLTFGIPPGFHDNCLRNSSGNKENHGYIIIE